MRKKSPPLVLAGFLLAAALAGYEWIVDFDFEDRSRGWVLLEVDNGGGHFELLRTEDGGRSWSVVGRRVGPSFDPRDSPDRAGIHFADSRNGWFFGEGLYSTRDGGRTWKDEKLGPVADVASSGGTVWVARAVPPRSEELPYGKEHTVEILESPVGRSDWKPIRSQPDTYALWRRGLIRRGKWAWILSTSEPNTIPEVKPRHRLWFTSDGGATWGKLPNPCTEDSPMSRLVSIPGIEQGLALACGNVWDPYSQPFHVFRSSDGGRSWREARASAEKVFRSISSFTASSWERFWVEGYRSAPSLLDARSGWSDFDWEAIAPEYAAAAQGSFRGIRFVDERHGWVGYELVGCAYLIHTTDGGLHWKAQTITGDRDFRRERSVTHATQGVSIVSLECDAERVEGGGTVLCRGRLSGVPRATVTVTPRGGYSDRVQVPEEIPVDGTSFEFEVMTDRSLEEFPVKIAVSFEGGEAGGDCRQTETERSATFRLTKTAGWIPPTPPPPPHEACSAAARPDPAWVWRREEIWRTGRERLREFVERGGAVFDEKTAADEPMGVHPGPDSASLVLRGCIEIVNRWQELQGDTIVGVYAGSEPRNPSVGLLILTRRSADSGFLSAPAELLHPPGGGGTLSIRAASGQRLRILSSDGKAWIFLVPTRMWVKD